MHGAAFSRITALPIHRRLAVLLLTLALWLGAFLHVRGHVNSVVTTTLDSLRIRAQLATVLIASSAAAVCFAYSMAGSNVVVLQQEGAFAPPAVLGLMGVAILLLVHAPIIFVSSSVSLMGLEPQNLRRARATTMHALIQQSRIITIVRAIAAGLL